MPGYKLSRRAENDLTQLYADGIDAFGLNQADSYLAGLFDTLAFLADYPLAARERPELTPPARVHRYKSHIIIYRLRDDAVFVLRVRHGREDWVNAN